LRNLKTAALAMYIDNMDDFDKGTAKIKDSTATTPAAASGATEFKIDDVVKYMNGGDNFSDTGYDIVANDEGWFLQYTISGTSTETAQIKEKLKGRARAVGLLATASNKATTTGSGNSTTTTPAYYAAADDNVYYFVR
ncbi:MAG: hypothetical protein II917_06140, partial [Synergistaceae bacterium]|nr:hypothetical protein [Synergistaceae bacterium]